jgi:hypothetical protein
MDHKHPSHFLEAAAALTVVASWWDIIPSIAAGVGGLYYGYMLYEKVEARWRETSTKQD